MYATQLQIFVQFKAARFFFVANQVGISCSLFLVIDRSQIHNLGSEDLGKMNH